MSKIIFSVSELNLACQKLLESHFPAIWVEGEISNLVRPSSGHYYFSLKDQKAQIRCALFRQKTLGLPFEPRNGLLVQVLAKASLYPDRGDYQLIVERMEIAGDGLLKKAFDELVKKLKSEGLFEEQWKKPLPTLPRHIAVITSPTGAAIRDILTALKRRFPSIPITIYPTKVQGVDAAPEIVKAIDLANRHAVADIIILARGGGSLEDLWSFNEEIVARAIFKSDLPIITGVGHEIDFTIADFVADKRAATPTAAAELVTPNQAIIAQQLIHFENRLISEISKQLQYRYQKLDWLLKRLRHPKQLIQNQLERFLRLEKRLFLSMQWLLKEKEASLKSLHRTLESISPIATLNRGYAIVSKAPEDSKSIDRANGKKKIVTSIEDVHEDEELIIQVKDGCFNVGVKSGQ